MVGQTDTSGYLKVSLAGGTISGDTIIDGNLTVNNDLLIGDAATDNLLVGATASAADFTNARTISSSADTGVTGSTNYIGVVGEANAASGTADGVLGIARVSGANTAIGVYGWGKVTNAADSGHSIGVSAYATDAHTGGSNYAFYANASGVTETLIFKNYAFYSDAGRVLTTNTFTTGGVDDYGIKIANTLNDAGAAGGSDVYRALSIQDTTTDTTGWNQTYLIGCGDGTNDVFQVDMAGYSFHHAANGNISVGHNNTYGIIATTYGPIVLSPVAGSGNYLIQNIAAGVTPEPGLQVDGAAHTTCIAGTEFYDVHLNLGRTVEFATGALSVQRAVLIDPPTYAFVGASTLSFAIGFAINGSPDAGANATISNSISMAIGNLSGKQSSCDSVTTGVYIPEGITDGVGNVSGRTVLAITSGAANVDLGNQTADLNGFYGLNISAMSLESDTNTRTIAEAASLKIGGTPTNAGNVVFTSGPFALLVSNANSQFEFGATDKLYLKSVSPTHTGTAGVVDMDITTGTADVNGIDVYVTLGSDDDGVTGISSKIQGYSAGGTSGNASVAFEAILIGDNNDTSHEYLAFDAGDFTATGGAGQSIALNVGTSYDALIYAESGDFYFANYAPVLARDDDGVAITAATEATSLIFGDSSLSRIWAAGAGPLATQRDYKFTGLTYIGNAGGALTITNAATVYIDAAPTAGANMTISNAYAMWIDSGNVRIDSALRMGDGTNALPSFSFLSDPDTGIYLEAGSMRHVVGSAVKMAVSNSGVGSDTFLTWSAVGATLKGADGDDAAAVGVILDNSTALTTAGGKLTSFRNATVEKAYIDYLGGLTISQGISTTGVAVAGLTVTGGAHTGLTAATEAIGINFNLSASKTWAAGAGPLASQREILIQAPTYVGNAGGALTITAASTVFISGPPIAGANMTITNPRALRVDSGIAQFGGTVLVGDDANFTDCSATKMVVSQGDTGLTSTSKNGIVGEGVADGSVSGAGVRGYGKTSSAFGAYGVLGQATVAATGDTTTAYGLYGVSGATHAGGDNVGGFFTAYGGDDNIGVDISMGVIRLNNNGIAADTNNIDANKFYITAGDLSAGNTQLELYGEGTAVSVSAETASTHKVGVKINGTQYYFLVTNA